MHLPNFFNRNTVYINEKTTLALGTCPIQLCCTRYFDIVFGFNRTSLKGRSSRGDPKVEPRIFPIQNLKGCSRAGPSFYKGEQKFYILN